MSTLHPPTMPTLEDAAKIARLVESISELDRYSPYLYLVLCDRFAETCAVSIDERGECGAFVTGLRPPMQPSTLFVWQVGVRQDLRGRGLGNQLLTSILARHQEVRFVETTVAPSNIPSQRLFSALARELKAECCILPGYPPSLFPGPHEAEPLWRIGPFDWRPR